MRCLKAFLIACAIVLLAIGVTPGRAVADEGWVINSMNAQVDVQRDGMLFIIETLLVDFGSQRKHGIFRDIPIRYDYNEEQNRVYDFRMESVTDVNGNRHQYELSDQGGYMRIKIGDPDREISGPQSYRITYRLGRVMNPFEGHDELFLNIIGPPAWPVRIERATATVAFPSDGVQEVTCFQGATGTTETCRFSNTARTAAFETTRPLPERQNFTVVVSVAKGVVQEPTLRLEDKPRDFLEFFEINPLTVGAAAALLAAVIGGVIFAYSTFGRDRRYTSIYYLSDNPAEETPAIFSKDPIVLEFQPPEGLKPAQMGLLLDESADTLDVTATIVDLAVRGYLQIKEIEREGIISKLFSGKDWELLRTGKDAGDLDVYERTILDGIFEDGNTVKLSDLKNEFYTHLNKAKTQLYEDAMRNSWFPFRPDHARTFWSVTGFFLLFLGVGAAFGLGMLFGAGIVGFPISLGGILLILMSHNMPRRSALGREMMRRTLGFRQYVATAEKDRQKFNEQQNLFAEYLPYAIIFHCVDKWANAFKDIDVQESVRTWYTGTGPFYAAAFTSNLQGFSSSVSSSIQSTPSSSGSSGFGGGGFSGGGGGGGGGGSW